jgi:hypothetical protein
MCAHEMSLFAAVRLLVAFAGVEAAIMDYLPTRFTLSKRRLRTPVETSVNPMMAPRASRENFMKSPTVVNMSVASGSMWRYSPKEAS